jgi:Protein of unknown function (DUF3137)
MPLPSIPIAALENLEKLRLKVLKGPKRYQWHVIIAFIILIIPASILYFFADHNDHSDIRGGLIYITGIMFSIFFGIIQWKIHQQHKQYQTQFRETIIKPLLQTLEPEIVYLPNKFIPRPQFEFSQLFQHYGISSYEGDNYIKRNYPDFTLYLSQLTVYSNFEDNKQKKLAFKGVFLVFSLDHQFDGATLILEKNNPGPFGSINILEKLFEDNPQPTFKLLSYSDGELIEGHRIFTTFESETKNLVVPELVDMIKEIQAETGENVQISFIKKLVCISISTPEDFFETDPDFNIMDPNSITLFQNNFKRLFSYAERFAPIVITAIQNDR